MPLPQPVFVREAAPSPASPDPIDFLSDMFTAQAVALTAAIEDDMGTHPTQFTSIYTPLTLGAQQRMDIQQAYVNKAYLHANLDKELYILKQAERA
ncbi:hypothetical protein JCM21900_003679 [Sporobolomyces salmonicolor]